VQEPLAQIRNFRPICDVATGMKGNRAAIIGAAAACTLAHGGAAAHAGERGEVRLALGQKVATLTRETPIAAGQGWLVWSVETTNTDFKLHALHDGRETVLPLAARPVPFDASVGSDAVGRPVVTFSKCGSVAEMASVGTGEGGVLEEPATARDCRVRMLELEDGRESAVPVPHPRGTSDTAPAMWRGAVAFARMEPRHGLVSQVRSWTPRHPLSVRMLTHGIVPSKCPTRAACRHGFGWGEVQSLAFDGTIVAFTWARKATWRPNGAGWEGRIDVLRTGRSTVARVATARDERRGLHRAVTGDVCMGPNPDEFEWPGTTFLAGSSAYFSSLEDGYCFTRFGGRLFTGGGSRRSAATFAVPVLSWATDGSNTYALVAPQPRSPLPRSPSEGLNQEPDELPGCALDKPCTLTSVQPPVLTPAPLAPRR
jgi:hypothetical protein